jgi:hypothetical protein
VRLITHVLLAKGREVLGRKAQRFNHLASLDQLNQLLFGQQERDRRVALEKLHRYTDRLALNILEYPIVP